MGEERVFFRDVKPYYAPQSLDELEGPDGGVIVLDHDVLWAPGDGSVDLDRPGGTTMAYQALLAEGMPHQQVRGLNRARLIQVWPELALPVRVRTLWEDRFPELVGPEVSGRARAGQGATPSPQDERGR